MTHTSSLQTGSSKLTTSCVQAHCWVMSGQEKKGEKGRIFDSKTEWLKISFNTPAYAPHKIHINSQDVTPYSFDKNIPSPDHYWVQSANVKNTFLESIHCATWWPDDGIFLPKHVGKSILTTYVVRCGTFAGIIKNRLGMHGLTKFKIKVHTVSCTMT
jgi:hypothetical protein